MSADVLIDAVPQLRQLADVSGEQISNIGSQDMNDAVWLKLTKRVNQLLASDQVNGIVITHGTDTLEETAYFLHLVTKSQKPVVLTAAMRPATGLSADGPLNIFNAVAVAADPDASSRGVLVVINDDIHGARAFTKTHTTDLQTFASGERGLIGTVQYGISRFFRTPYTQHTVNAPFDIRTVEELPRVDILYAHAGMSADLIEAAVKNGAQGLVVAGVGNGNMNEKSLTTLSTVSKKGIACVRSTRLPTGVVGRNVETDDDALGLIASMELNPAKARVLLKLALLKTNDPREIQEMFVAY
jgi:L-asparaginase